MMLFMPVLNGSSQALWQSKTAPDIQGRVFAVRRMFAWVAQPLAIILAGPLVDGVFQPLMAEGGRLAPTVGRLIGVGPGRGTGLLLIVLGIFVFVMSIVAYTYPRLRLVEDELSDYVADEDETDHSEGLEFSEVPAPVD